MARSSGILLHPTSLPGPHGIGTLGGNADRLVEALDSMGQSWWQMLPIGPTGYGDSPYQSPSTFAGNPLLLDLDLLVHDGLLLSDELEPIPEFPARTVDYGRVIPWKRGLLEIATGEFFDRAGPELLEACAAFRERHGRVWLDDFALFAAIKREHDERPWWEWEQGLALRDPTHMEDATARLAPAIDRMAAEQFLFDRQFDRLKRTAASHGVRLIGDIPIFVAHDSADVWAHRDLFHLDDLGMPTVVAGVPPDYFSETGQRWGNPLYDWDRHQEGDFAWWTARMGRMFELFDLVRVDHFRGFSASWHIPASEPTAVEGRWVKAPGEEFFDHLLETFRVLPVIAEDLGVITPDVEELRDRYSFPGMKILQFGFGTESVHAPERFRRNVVAYTGTHDNDTAIGWYRDPRPDRERERARALEVLGSDGTEFHWDLIQAVMNSVADTTVVPMQDLLGLDSTARMNLPATTTGNWRWRMTWESLTPDVVERMKRLTVETDRWKRT